MGLWKKYIEWSGARPFYAMAILMVLLLLSTAGSNHLSSQAQAYLGGVFFVGELLVDTRIKHKKILFAFWQILSFGCIILSLAYTITNNYIILILAISSGTLVIVVTCFSITHTLFKVKIISPDILAIGFIGYLIAAYGFGFIYFLLHEIISDAFLYHGKIIVQNMLWEKVYFSLVTITTLGYGDICPNVPLIRMLAALESVLGVFYLTVLIGKMVGLLLQKEPHN